MYRLTTPTGRTYPDFAKILQYVKSANDEKNPDARDLMAACKLAKTVNLRLKGLINTRQTAVTSFDFSIKRKDNNEIDVETQNNLSRVIYRILKKHVTTPLFGCFAVNFVWQPLDETNPIQIPKKLRFYSPTEMLQKPNGITIVDDNNKIVTQLDIDEYYPDFLLEIDDEYEEIGGLMRAVLVLEVLRWEMRSENANLLSTLKGILQIINRGDTEGVDEENAINAAKQARKDKFVVTNELIEFKMNQIVSGDLSAFKSLIDDINNEISIAILGQANTQQLPNNGGSRAALQILKLISADIHYSDMQRCTDLINQLLAKYYAINYGTSPSVCPIYFEFNYESEENHVNNADIVATLTSAGVPLKKVEVYKKTGFSVPEVSDEVFTVLG